MEQHLTRIAPKPARFFNKYEELHLVLTVKYVYVKVYHTWQLKLKAKVRK